MTLRPILFLAWAANAAITRWFPHASSSPTAGASAFSVPCSSEGWWLGSRGLSGSCPVGLGSSGGGSWSGSCSSVPCLALGTGDGTRPLSTWAQRQTRLCSLLPAGPVGTCRLPRPRPPSPHLCSWSQHCTPRPQLDAVTARRPRVRPAFLVSGSACAPQAAGCSHLDEA